jgi:two-component system, NarL family, sensor kinase
LKVERRQRPGQLAELRARLAEDQETLQAIRTGAVDAVMVADKSGPRVYTLEGADHAYRELIEAMNEGALTLTSDKLILYANQCFAKMVKCPLEQVISASFNRFLSTEDQQALWALLKRGSKAGSKLQASLKAGDGSQIPVLISTRPLAGNGSKGAILSVLVTDMTETRRNEELLRGLSNRLVQAQETERGRVALELHDNITQLLCAALVRSQILAEQLPLRQRALRGEALMLHGMLGRVADEVERISQNLRPSVLEHLGLATLLRRDSEEFAKRIGVSLKINCVKLTKRLPAETELAFYRILQEALKNIEQHACARHVDVLLRQDGLGVEMTIQDDGVGFDPARHSGKRKAKPGFGLLSMRERAAGVGGVLSVRSDTGQGTTIRVKAPFAKSGGTRSHTLS